MKKSKAKIIFLTSTNLASNPRCFKEIVLARELGYDVIVFAFDIPNWTRKVEEQIRGQLPEMEYYSLQTSRLPWLPWFINSLAGKAGRKLYQLGWRSTWISAIATDKRTLVLLKALQKERPAGDLIIAHNPGAFYPAWQLSHKTGIPFAADIEDFHPGENNGRVAKEAVTRLMQAILPKAYYISFASPLIREATLSLLNKASLRTSLVINNVFSSREFPQPKFVGNSKDEKLRLVWFSQHISFGRGIDEILPLLEPFSAKLQLTLIGNIDLQFKQTVLDRYTFIKIEEPLPQALLNASLGNYDIGLALESNRTDENRKMCLTNKIWAYLQAGLSIWANNTPAQLQFAQEFPLNTIVIDLNHAEIILTLIRTTLETLSETRKNKLARWEINQQVSWETEKKKLIKQWETQVQN